MAKWVLLIKGFGGSKLEPFRGLGSTAVAEGRKSSGYKSS
jgi:hypothetical protein